MIAFVFFIALISGNIPYIKSLNFSKPRFGHSLYHRPGYYSRLLYRMCTFNVNIVVKPREILNPSALFVQSLLLCCAVLYITIRRISKSVS